MHEVLTLFPTEFSEQFNLLIPSSNITVYTDDVLGSGAAALSPLSLPFPLLVPVLTVPNV